MWLRLQVVVDNPDLVFVLSALNRTEPAVDVIECDTILTIAEGLRAVYEIRALYPGRTILTDVRIAEARPLISRRCFEAEATWVSCVSDTSLATIGQVIKVVAEFSGEAQVKLGESYNAERVRTWRELGVGHVTVRRSRDREAAGDLSRGPDDLMRISKLAGLSFTVIITGGIKAAKLGIFIGAPVGVVIAERSIMRVRGPLAAAQELQEAIGRTWP